jgi:hypothetical protein
MLLARFGCNTVMSGVLRCPAPVWRHQSHSPPCASPQWPPCWPAGSGSTGPPVAGLSLQVPERHAHLTLQLSECAGDLVHPVIGVQAPVRLCARLNTVTSAASECMMQRWTDAMIAPTCGGVRWGGREVVTKVAQRKLDGVPQLVAPMPVCNHLPDIQVDVAALCSRRRHSDDVAASASQQMCAAFDMDTNPHISSSTSWS